MNRYFLQLTQGCGQRDCSFKLCASCSSSKKISPDAASVIAVQLASRPKRLLCPQIQNLTMADIEARSLFRPQESPRAPQMTKESASSNFLSLRPFLSSMLSFTSLSHFFETPHAETASDGGYSSDGPLDPSSPARNEYQSEKISPFSKKDTLARTKSPLIQNKMLIKSPSLDSVPLMHRISSREGPSAPPETAEKLYQKVLKDDLAIPRLTPSSSVDSLTSLLHEELLDSNAPLPYFTSHLFESSIKTLNEDCHFLRDSILHVFGSRSRLGKSFLDSDSSPSHPSTLDLKAVEEFYRIYVDLEPSDKLKSALLDSIEFLLTKIVKRKKYLKNGDESVLRCLMIVLEVRSHCFLFCIKNLKYFSK